MSASILSTALPMPSYMPLLHTSPIAAARFMYRASSMIKSCTAPIALSCVSPARQYPPRAAVAVIGGRYGNKAIVEATKWLSAYQGKRQYPPRVKNLNAAFSLRLQGASSTTGILLRAHSEAVESMLALMDGKDAFEVRDADNTAKDSASGDDSEDNPHAARYRSHYPIYLCRNHV